MRLIGALGLTFVGVLLSPALGHATADRITLLQLDAYVSDARNEALLVREAAERIAKAPNPDTDTSWAALNAAVTNLGRQSTIIELAGAPGGYASVAAAVADVERDRQALRASVTARDAHAIREDCAHVLQAINRVDRDLDRLFAAARLQRLQFLGIDVSGR